MTKEKYLEIILSILLKKLGGEVEITPEEMEEGTLYLSVMGERVSSCCKIKVIDIRKEKNKSNKN